MSDPIDTDKPSEPTNRIDELLDALRSALANDASPEARSAGATACRAILGALDPAALRNSARPPPSPPANSSFTGSPLGAALGGSPLGAALGALSSIPREQIVEFLVTGLRAVFSQSAAPSYRSPPARPHTVPDEPR